MFRGFAKTAFLAAALFSGAETLSAQRGGARPPPPRPATTASIAPEEEFSPPSRNAASNVATEEETISGSAAQNQIFYTLQQQQNAALARTMAGNTPESPAVTPASGIDANVLNTLIADGSPFALDDALKSGFPHMLAAYVAPARADLRLGDWPEADEITAAQRQAFIGNLEKYWQEAVLSAASPQQAEQLGLDAKAASHLAEVQHKHNITPGQPLDAAVAADAYSDLSRGSNLGDIAGLGVGVIAVTLNSMLLYREIKKRQNASTLHV